MNAVLKRLGSSALSLALTATLSPAARADCLWKLVSTPDPAPSGNQLNAIAGTGAHDLWETGATYRTLTSKGYALHFDGKAWTVLREADPSGYGGQFSGIASIARNDVWAIGQTYGAGHYSKRSAAAEHWDGARFSVSPLPRVTGSETFLYGIAAIATNDVWAAGGALAHGGLQQPYVVHWNGSAWTQIAVPGLPGVANNLDAVAATASDDVWSVGGSQASASAPFRTLAEHWDGTQWSIVPTPNVNADSNVFNAVVALSRHDAWAMGDYNNGRTFAPLAEHWDGTAWTIVPVPNSGTRLTFVFGATALAANDVFAAGEIARRKNGVASYLVHWNGKAWTTVPTPNVPHRPVTLLNAVKALPDGSVWAAGGDAGAKIVIDTVTEMRACAKEVGAARR